MAIRGGQSPPFLTVASTGVVVVGDWATGDGSPLPPILTDWDPASDLSLHSRIDVEGDRLLEECDIEPGSELRVAACWNATRTRLRGAGPSVTLRLQPEASSIGLSLEVLGSAVGGRLNVETVVSVHQSLPGSRLAATQPGQILHVARQSFLLEGLAARFPISVVDFRSEGALHPQAGWVLDWPSGDFTEPFGAGINLLINEGRSDIVEAIRTESDAPGGAWIRSRIYLDTARYLITTALHNDEFLDGHETFEAGTVGHAVRQLIDTAWPNLPLRALRTQMLEQATRFESELQGNFWVDRS